MKYVYHYCAQYQNGTSLNINYSDGIVTFDEEISDFDSYLNLKEAISSKFSGNVKGIDIIIVSLSMISKL